MTSQKNNQKNVKPNFFLSPPTTNPETKSQKVLLQC